MNWWPKRGPNGDAKRRAEQEALLRTAEKMTPVIEKLADHLRDLPPEELATRLRLAMIRRSA
jgi:hypothetical protein